MKVPLRKTINFLLIVLPMAAMITAAVPYVRRSADKVIDNLHEIISHEASTRLGCDAKVEKAVVRNLGSVALYDVTVTAKDKSNKNKLHFNRIDIKYNWRNLVKTRKLSELKITEIDIVRPDLDIDNDIMKTFTIPKSEGGEPFKAPVKVIDGDIRFFDKTKSTRFDLSLIHI